MALQKARSEQLFKDLRMVEFGRVIQKIIDDPTRDHDSFEDKVKEALYAQRNARDRRRIDRLIREVIRAFVGYRYPRIRYWELHSPRPGRSTPA